MPAAVYETIQYEKSNGIGVITLNRPYVLNAVNERMGKELLGALRNGDRDDEVRCLILTGRGRGFCAGEDIQDLRGSMSGAKTPSLERDRSTNTTQSFDESGKCRRRLSQQ